MMQPSNITVRYKDVGVIFAVIIFLTVFCRLLGFSLIIPLVLLFSGCHLFFFKKADAHLFICTGLLLALIFGAANAVNQFTDIQTLYLPVASVAMLTMLLFNDLQLAFLMSFTSSVIVGLVLSFDLNLMLTFFVGSLTASYAVRNARTRGKLISAGFYVGLIQVVCIALVYPDLHFLISKKFAVTYLQPLFLGGILVSFVTMATLKIFEFLFGVMTNFSLLELSDFNQPLLKRMVLEAPGTYHHSIIVSNMAEAAADSIGTNALLTRVGAYYHDIGKMEKPEYYTENQLVGGNKHDNIEPSISRLVILNHVKEGVELARKNKLNPIIIDFIEQHHGKGLIHYFYQKALEEAADQGSVDEENYRYPGPKPQTKEAAIVLLADSSEAATRALDEPIPKKIEEVVRKIINNRFIDGQLDDCNLTLKEIEAIALTFTRILGAMYHSRIKYPEKKNGDNRNKKSSEENTAESPQNNQDNQKNP